MLQGFLIVLMFALAYGLLYVIYGKEGLKLREAHGKKNMGVLAGLVFILISWIMCIMFLIGGLAKGDTILCIAVAVIVPIFIAIWTVIARKNVKSALEQKSNHSNSED